MGIGITGIGVDIAIQPVSSITDNGILIPFSIDWETNENETITESHFLGMYESSCVNRSRNLESHILSHIYHICIPWIAQYMLHRRIVV